MSRKKNKYLSGLNGPAWGLTEDKSKAADKPLLQSTLALAVSTVTGAFTGAAMGKPSLYSGLATVITGHLLRAPVLSSFGMGMMVSGGYQVANGFEGTGMNGVKERIKAFGQDLKARSYIDKIIKPKDEIPSIEGLGRVQYFKYPLNGQLDMSALDRIEMDLASSAKQYQQTQMNGFNEDRIY